MMTGTLEKVCSKCGGAQIYKKIPIGRKEIEILDKPCPCQKREQERKEKEEKEHKEKYEEFEREVRIEQLKSRSMMDEKFKKSTFENWNKGSESEKLIKICKKYCENFKENKEENIGMLLYGNPGVGKTYAVSCITNYLINEQVSVICVSINGLLRQFRSTYNSDNRECENDILRDIKSVDLLIIDDLGTEQLTEWSNSMLYEILDTRYRANKPLIITTNFGSEEFRKRYHKRLNDRIFEMCPPVDCKGISLRGMLSKNKLEQIRGQIII